MAIASVAITLARRGKKDEVTRSAARKLNISVTRLMHFRRNVMARKIKDNMANWYHVQLALLQPLPDEDQDFTIKYLLGMLAPLEELPDPDLPIETE